MTIFVGAVWELATPAESAQTVPTTINMPMIKIKTTLSDFCFIVPSL
jgi:hypothetical protein